MGVAHGCACTFRGRLRRSVWHVMRQTKIGSNKSSRSRDAIASTPNRCVIEKLIGDGRFDTAFAGKIGRRHRLVRRGGLNGNDSKLRCAVLCI